MTKVIKPYVDDTYFDLVPRPTKDQRKSLKESIENEGQQEPIILDDTGRILDGHTRFEICQELHLKPKYVIREFTDEDAKKNFAITVNLKRRHLNDFQIYELFEKQIDMIRHENITKKGKSIWATRKGETKKQTYASKYQNATSAKASELTGLGRGIVESIIFLKKNADSKTIKKVRDGTLGIHKATDQLRRRTFIKSDKGSTYRSRIGIVFDIERCLVNSGDGEIISVICRKANLSHYASKEYLTILAKAKLVIENHVEQKGKYYNTKREITKYQLSEKGRMFYNKMIEMYGFLPKELQDSSKDGVELLQ